MLSFKIFSVVALLTFLGLESAVISRIICTGIRLQTLFIQLKYKITAQALKET